MNNLQFLIKQNLIALFAIAYEHPLTNASHKNQNCFQKKKFILLSKGDNCAKSTPKFDCADY